MGYQEMSLNIFEMTHEELVKLNPQNYSFRRRTFKSTGELRAGIDARIRCKARPVHRFDTRMSKAKCHVCGSRIPKGRRVTCSTGCKVKKTRQDRVTRARIRVRLENKAKENKAMGLASGFFESKPTDILPDWMRKILG